MAEPEKNQFKLEVEEVVTEPIVTNTTNESDKVPDKAPAEAAPVPAPAPAILVPQFSTPSDLAQRLSGLMQNPEVLAALQDKLGSMVGQPSGYIQSLPKVVKRRIKSLKKLQFEMIKIESKFYEEVHELECKYAEKYGPLFERRKDIGEQTIPCVHTNWTNMVYECNR